MHRVWPVDTNFDDSHPLRAITDQTNTNKNQLCFFHNKRNYSTSNFPKTAVSYRIFSHWNKLKGGALLLERVINNNKMSGACLYIQIRGHRTSRSLISILTAVILCSNQHCRFAAGSKLWPALATLPVDSLICPCPACSKWFVRPTFKRF